jgi:hypothetical protein
MSILKTINIKGEHISKVYALFKKNNVKHWPVRMIRPGMYEVTLKSDNPILSFLLLKYGG